MANGDNPSGWYTDPTGQGESRYWSGTRWTQSVSRGGVVVDVPIDASVASTPPVPGTQVAPPVPRDYRPPQTVTVTQPQRSALPGILFGIAAIFFSVLLIYAIVSNNDDSSNDGEPPTESTPPAAEDG